VKDIPNISEESQTQFGSNSFELMLRRNLDELTARHLHRRLRRVDSPQSTRVNVDGRTFLNFSSNDYLGLANDPCLKSAAAEAAARWGAGSGASRLISGSLTPHVELENEIADFKGTESAVCFSTGYAAALGTIPALIGKGDFIVVDKLVHACAIDAARLSGATLRAYRHNDIESLEDVLRWARKLPRPQGNILIVTESVFSMDGDLAPLQEIVRLKQQYGAWLMLDEAHATGLYGLHRRGLAEGLGVANHVEVQMGTLSKAVGASGGYICGSRSLVDFVINRGRSFIFSTAPVPAAAAAAREGIRIIGSPTGKKRRDRLWETMGELSRRLPLPNPCPSPIVPIMVGDEARAMAAAEAIRQRGIFLPAIRYPTVARKQARLRISLSAAHSTQDITTLTEALRDALA
jgi:8-amino-7-oxononanoate synthase